MRTLIAQGYKAWIENDPRRRISINTQAMAVARQAKN